MYRNFVGKFTSRRYSERIHTIHTHIYISYSFSVFTHAIIRRYSSIRIALNNSSSDYSACTKQNILYNNRTKSVLVEICSGASSMLFATASQIFHHKRCLQLTGPVPECNIGECMWWWCRNVELDTETPVSYCIWQFHLERICKYSIWIAYMNLELEWMDVSFPTDKYTAGWVAFICVGLEFWVLNRVWMDKEIDWFCWAKGMGNWHVNLFIGASIDRLRNLYFVSTCFVYSKQIQLMHQVVIGTEEINWLKSYAEMYIVENIEFHLNRHGLGISQLTKTSKGSNVLQAARANNCM